VSPCGSVGAAHRLGVMVLDAGYRERQARIVPPQRSQVVCSKRSHDHGLMHLLQPLARLRGAAQGRGSRRGRSRGAGAKPSCVTMTTSVWERAAGLREACAWRRSPQGITRRRPLACPRWTHDRWDIRVRGGLRSGAVLMAVESGGGCQTGAGQGVASDPGAWPIVRLASP